MSFIGLLTNKKNESIFLNYLNNHKYNNVIVINNKNMNNIKNVKFDTIIINKKIPEKSNIIKHILSNSNNLIINSDIDIGLKILNNTSSNIITFGFNPKATVTASSLESDDALICIQRNIKNIYNKTIEPQDIRVEKMTKINNPYIIMGFEIIELLYNS